MRRRPMRRSTTRTRRYIRRGIKPEVKYTTFSLLGAAIVQQNLAAADKTCAAINLTGPASTGGFFSMIGPGTGRDQRIGNKINIRKISIHYSPYLCPAAADANSYDTVQLRLLAPGTGNVYGGSDVTDFWSTNLTTHITDWPALSNYRVYLDKTINLQASNPITGPTRTGKGTMRTYKFTIKRRGPLEYLDGSLIPKYVHDRFPLYHFCYSPHVTNATQLVCVNYQVRVYFTDV